MEEATAAAKSAFKTWRQVPTQQRARVMLKYQVWSRCHQVLFTAHAMLRTQGLIRDNMDELAKLVTLEQGKTLPDARGDVFRGLGA